ncbi:hypothetical protein NW752_001167 [Fusarium irregulare]|uniref:Epoxide hydrolase N-terminal domain-containing protein n=1 Tax=Fusarium irregulare TaxID=2494466 RepID=A0A9W8U604_9HYPO|nr:hypothetical protein NW766_010746 [Fusarium irregulare]KAJ4026228.1 hypothetical protein NW752_001167 [Fusarium irregulare]
MTSIKPYKINISPSRLERLMQKLALADFPDPDYLEKDSWTKGPPVREIERLVDAWQTVYNWRDVEARLNELPQFMTPIDISDFGAFNIHLVHRKSTKADAIPLLFLHGWPGSFYEVARIINPLIQGDDNAGPTFHVVAPSLIDFGFSSPSKVGFGLEHHAEVYDKLMQTLGYHHYVIQGGDVGGLISRYMAKLFGPSRCLAHHINTPLPSQPTEETHPELHAQSLTTPLTEIEQRGLVRAATFEKEGSGYYKLQSTKPMTIGYSLKDSPVGLLAWIYEKLYDWSDDYLWTDEEILTWVSIYYFSTPGPDASSKVYYTFEHCEPSAFAAAGAYVDVPLGISRFLNDLVFLPKHWNQTLSPIVYQAEHDKGGHFAAWEQPGAIVKDLRLMFGTSGIGPEIGERLKAAYM